MLKVEKTELVGENNNNIWGYGIHTPGGGILKSGYIGARTGKIIYVREINKE